MALVECRECKRQVSTEAIACPNCGVATPGATKEEIIINIKKGIFAQQRWVSGVAFFGGLAWLFFAAKSGGKDAFVDAFDGAKWLIGGGFCWYIASEIDRNLYERKLKKQKK
ncbi:hypothetical protein UNDYM_1635 [Undibacterium sp. YM2]|uniref:hypothetical protein n=1 Tax=Undibacterium sp. YM2 TaxID=2058625 RepID=UPI001331CE93|nr:hypothetical protein [Undibacterium sp. YM2]BBB65888.1 hypothetical protein UNDYM_1635 [Undibacterium sp. YM2]